MNLAAAIRSIRNGEHILGDFEEELEQLLLTKGYISAFGNVTKSGEMYLVESERADLFCASSAT